jgi:hypothetical protein
MLKEKISGANGREDKPQPVRIPVDKATWTAWKRVGRVGAFQHRFSFEEWRFTPSEARPIVNGVSHTGAATPTCWLEAPAGTKVYGHNALSIPPVRRGGDHDKMDTMQAVIFALMGSHRLALAEAPEEATTAPPKRATRSRTSAARPAPPPARKAVSRK